MTSRSWTWLQTRIRGLLNHPVHVTRISVALKAVTDEGGPDVPRPR